MSGGLPVGYDWVNCNNDGNVNGTGTGVSITGGAQAFSAYTTVIAKTPYDTTWVVATILYLPNNNAINTVNFAVGPSGSEQVFASNLVRAARRSANAGTSTYCFPCVIQAGSRISAAVYSPGVGDQLFVSCLLFDNGMIGQEGAAGIEGIAWTGGTTGDNAVVFTSGAANTLGSYVTYIAATARDYMGLICTITNGNVVFASDATPSSTLYYDIAVGASGSEQNIVSQFLVGFVECTSNASQPGPSNGSPSPFFPVLIPAGSRLAMRFGCTGATQTGHFMLYGVYQ
jgi:hypothetical protein